MLIKFAYKMEVAGVNKITLYENKGILLSRNVDNITILNSISNSGTIDVFDYCVDVNYSSDLEVGLNYTQLKKDAIEFFIQDFSKANRQLIERFQNSKCGYIVNIEYLSGLSLVIQEPLFFEETEKSFNNNSFVMTLAYKKETEKEYLELNIVVDTTPIPPEGADVLFWYGQSYSNYTIIGGTPEQHSVVQGETIDISRTDSGNVISSIEIQSNFPYTGGAGKNLVIRYETTDISTGTITLMESTLVTLGGGSADISARIQVTNFAVDGEHLVISPNKTSITSTYYNTIVITSNSALYTIKISEIYYL